MASITPQVRPVGPTTAQIMIVGEAPGETEVKKGEPFLGAAGQELDRMLHEAGLSRTECFITNVCRVRPPQNKIENFFSTKTKRTMEHIQVRDKYVTPHIVDGMERLQKEIELVKPNIIIALGNVAMWALTGNWGIKSWRGSLLENNLGSHKCKVIPTTHPAAILRMYSERVWAITDLKRVMKERSSPVIVRPHYEFIIRPNFNQVSEKLHEVLDQLNSATKPLHLSCDIETRAGQIACIGFAWSKTQAMCIPLMCVENPEGYWMPEEEVALMWELYQVLTHPMAWVSGQNFSYDMQYFQRHLHYAPRLMYDTMIGHHSMMPGTRKSLDFLSSIYCDQHLFWKDDGKEWNVRGMSEDSLWSYNCVDCVRTFEIAEKQLELQPRMVADDVFNFQQLMFWPLHTTMTAGVRSNEKLRSQFNVELIDAMSEREQFLESIVGHRLNQRSPKQMSAFFYTDMGQPVIKNRVSQSPTCDDDALAKIASREPLLAPLCNAILELRSLGVFLSTFVNSRLDIDGRIRCSYNITGTETFRLSSSQSAFNSGHNLQNVPSGGKGDSGLMMPNLRKLFIPDPGFDFFDGDLDRADLQVVAWEANEDSLKEALKAGYDLHLWNANDLFDLGLDPNDLIESAPNYEDYKSKYNKQRQLAKSWVHGTNYGGGAYTMARNCGLSVAQAERFRSIYFHKRPGIADWHERVEAQLRSRRFVENKFGHRRYYFDRVDTLLPEALAWIPQSSVGLYINMIWVMLLAYVPEVQILLQVHDSLGGQIPSHLRGEVVRKMEDTARKVIIPYDDPLVIPFSVHTSPISWGDCK
jgi:uracil-DNA glycosylase family 4